MSNDLDKSRQNFLIVFVIVALAVVISLLHISVTKGKSRFLIAYIVVFLAIAAAVAALVWPRSASVVGSGVPIDSGIPAQVSEDGSVFHAEDTAFAPYPDEFVDAGICEVPK